MPFFSGFAGEFGRQLAQNRADEAAKSEKQNALESGILQHLSTSPDHDIASTAITGLIDLANPNQKKASGLSGWLGKMAQHPALPTIRQLVAAGRPESVPGQDPHFPTLQGQSGLDAVPGQQVPIGQQGDQLSNPDDVKAAIGQASRGESGPIPGVAQAATPPPAPAPLSAGSSPLAQSQAARRTALTPGGATPSGVGAAAVPPPAGPAGSSPSSRAPFAAGDSFQPGSPATTRMVPRQVFDSPEEVAGKTAEFQRRGVLAADIGAMRGGPGQPPLTPEEQGTIFGHVPASFSGGTGQGKMFPAGSVDNMGQPLNPEAYYSSRVNPRDPSQMIHVPVAAPASALSGRVSFQHFVGPDGKTPGVYRVVRGDGVNAAPPPQFLGYSGAKGTYLQYEDPNTHEITYVAAPAIYTAGAELPTSNQAPTPGAVPGAGPAQGGPSVEPAQAGQAGQAGPAATAPPGPAPAGPAGISGGRKDLNYTPEQGAFIGPNGEPQVGTALFDKGTGTYHSTQDPSQPATGFIPGPEGSYAVTAYQQANATLLTMHAAMKAIEDAGMATNNSTAATTMLMRKFYSGTTGDNPIDASVASLTNLAGLQGATQYIRSNSRSYQMFQQALMHLPRAPSEANAQRSRIPGLGAMVNPGVVGALGGHGWDSPQSMYAKLKQATEVIQQGKASLQELTGKTADRAVGAGGGGGGQGGGQEPAATAPPPASRGGKPAAAAVLAGPTLGERRLLQTAQGPVQAEWDGQGWKAVAAGAGTGAPAPAPTPSTPAGTSGAPSKLPGSPTTAVAPPAGPTRGTNISPDAYQNFLRNRGLGR